MLRISSFILGSWSLGTPWSPSRLASRCTARKMPVKYSSAGRIAFSATLA